jgi:thymidylate kinase
MGAVGLSSLLYALGCVLTAWDRRALALELRRRAASGGIVICDRYPSVQPGAMDSARLVALSGGGLLSSVFGRLAALERHLYRQIPPPDVVVRLTVPVDVAIARNRERQKRHKEGDDYVLHRHLTGVVPQFPTARTFDVRSDEPREQTVGTVRRLIWSCL